MLQRSGRLLRADSTRERRYYELPCSFFCRGSTGWPAAKCRRHLCILIRSLSLRLLLLGSYFLLQRSLCLKAGNFR